MSTTFYNKNGKPIAYTGNDRDIYLFNGTPVAYISSDSIYSFPGKHLGWYINGWIIDHSGRRVFFTRGATGGPGKPGRRGRPGKSGKKGKPGKGGKEGKPGKPGITNSWSSMSSKEFFE